MFIDIYTVDKQYDSPINTIYLLFTAFINNHIYGKNRDTLYFDFW